MVINTIGGYAKRVLFGAVSVPSRGAMVINGNGLNRPETESLSAVSVPSRGAMVINNDIDMETIINDLQIVSVPSRGAMVINK